MIHEEKPGHGGMHWLMAVAFVCLVFSFQSAYAILSRSMAEALRLSVVEITLVGSTYTWCFAAAQVAAGPLLDRVGAQRILPIACTLFVLGVFCFGFATGAKGLLAAQVFLASGASFGFIGAGFVGGLWFPAERYGTMFAWVQFTASVVACVAQAMAIVLIERFPWNWIVNAVGISGLVLVLVFLLYLRDPPRIQMRGWPRNPLQFLSSITEDLLVAIRKPGMIPVLLLGALSFGVMLAIGVLWGPRLGTALGLSAQGSSLSAASWLGLAIGAPLFAKAARHWPPHRLFLFGYLGQAATLFWITGLPLHSLEGFATQMFLFGVMSGTSMLPFTMAADRVGARYAGTSAALVNGLQFIAGGLLMSLPGYLLNRGLGGGNLHLVLLVLPAAMLLASPLFLFLSRDARAQHTAITHL